MPPDPDRRPLSRVTIRHLAVLVAFAAVASAVVMPQARRSSDPWRLLFVACVEVPYALLAPALILVRSGPAKSWLVAFLCCVPLVAFAAWLGVGLYLTVLSTWVVWSPFGIVAVFFAVVCVAMAGGGLAILSKWAVPRTCPACRRPALLRDGSVPRAERFEWPSEPRTCMACGSRFRRERRGPWVDVATLPPRPGRPARPSRTLPTATTEHDPR